MDFLDKAKNIFIFIYIVYLCYISYPILKLFKIDNFNYSKNVKKLAICIICRDDEECLKENIEYHSSIGVEHFIIYDNNSKNPLKNALKSYKNVTVLDWPGKLQQFFCYLDCLNKFKTKFKWIAFIDIDEFIVMKDGSIDLKDFLDPYCQYGGLGINWLCFGSSGHLKKQKSVINGFTIASFKHSQNSRIKSIVNTKYVLCPSRNAHCFIYKTGAVFVDEDFINISSSINRLYAPRKTKQIKRSKIQINHYIVRSREDFNLRKSRPAFSNTSRCSEEFWNSFQNGSKDTAILDLIKRVKKSKKTSKH